MCAIVTICNGSKSHKPFSINNCNGVTGVPHLTWMPPMTRMGRLPYCGEGDDSSQSNPSVSSVKSVLRGTKTPTLPKVVPAASTTLGKDP
jgi:hypothetical protein